MAARRELLNQDVADLTPSNAAAEMGNKTSSSSHDDNIKKKPIGKSIYNRRSSTLKEKEDQHMSNVNKQLLKQLSQQEEEEEEQQSDEATEDFSDMMGSEDLQGVLLSENDHENNNLEGYEPDANYLGGSSPSSIPSASSDGVSLYLKSKGARSSLTNSRSCDSQAIASERYRQRKQYIQAAAAMNSTSGQSTTRSQQATIIHDDSSKDSQRDFRSIARQSESSLSFAKSSSDRSQQLRSSRLNPLPNLELQQQQQSDARITTVPHNSPAETPRSMALSHDAQQVFADAISKAQGSQVDDGRRHHRESSSHKESYTSASSVVHSVPNRRLSSNATNNQAENDSTSISSRGPNRSTYVGEKSRRDKEGSDQQLTAMPSGKFRQIASSRSSNDTPSSDRFSFNDGAEALAMFDWDLLVSSTSASDSTSTSGTRSQRSQSVWMEVALPGAEESSLKSLRRLKVSNTTKLVLKSASGASLDLKFGPKGFVRSSLSFKQLFLFASGKSRLKRSFLMRIRDYLLGPISHSEPTIYGCCRLTSLRLRFPAYKHLRLSWLVDLLPSDHQRSSRRHMVSCEYLHVCTFAPPLTTNQIESNQTHRATCVHFGSKLKTKLTSCNRLQCVHSFLVRK